MGQTLTLWTIRASLAIYVLCLGRELLRAAPSVEDSRVWRRFWDWLWLTGACLCGVHILLAFFHYHDLSHQRAVQETARETKELLGFAFGGGVYFNYLFMTIWFGDAVWRLLAPSAYDGRPMWIHAAIHTYLLFIAVNGAIVFEQGAVRVIGLISCFCLALLAYVRFRRFKSLAAIPTTPP